jgi:hypothetical protein
MANQVLYGFTNLKDLFSRRVTEVGAGVVNDAITQSVEEHNRQITALISLFVKQTTEFKITYQTPIATRLQPLDDQGRALPIKMSGSYGVAFPIQAGGGAWGVDYVSREQMTVQEANDITNTLLSADARWVRDHILACIFDNVGWSFRDKAHDVLAIKGPANGDTDVYLVQAGADAGATDTHFLAQAAAIADVTNPFPTIYTELTEHPENQGEGIVFVPTSNKAAVEGLTGFVPARRPEDPVQQGANTAVLASDLAVDVPGKVFGYVDDFWCVHWPVMPSDYLIAVTSDGEPPLGMREYPVASLQGFRRVASRDDHPFYESQWLRHAGFGAWNRVGVVIQRVGNASYAVPTNYTTPMP